uniref:Ammonium transporter n=1 Tax=Globodera pallida TaxID=36090 RepID=A0A183CPC2_GLOPA
MASQPNDQLMANLSDQLFNLQKELDTMKKDMTANNDAFFNCAMALIIFLMQCGFAFLEAGAVRSKNCTNIIIKNVLDSLLGVIAYATVGWALAYGTNPLPMLEPYFGFSQFGMAGTTDFSKFLFQFVFCATASTIISGAVAERAEFACFLTYSLAITAFVYPVLTHWGWTKQGWMASGFAVDETHRVTYVDFAGSGMVHVCGGTISLIAAILIGPRIGRFPERTVIVPVGSPRRKQKEPKSVEIKGHSVPFASLGGFILMFGFLAFNGGSTSEISSPGIGQTVAKAMVNTILCGAFAALSYLFVHFVRKGKWTVLLTINACLTGTNIASNRPKSFASLGGFILMFGFLAFNGGSTSEISSPGIGQTVAKAMVNTILCGAFAALSYLFVHFVRKGKWTVLLTINACLTGMVAACAGCNQMHAWTCVITGSVAGMVYLLLAELALALRVDDPLDAFAVHFGGGLWGLISACLVTTEQGILYAFIGDVKLNLALWQLLWQLVCVLAIILWCTLTMAPAFLLLKAFGKMRVPREVEIRGLDIYKHGEAAYPSTAYGHGWDEAAVRPNVKEELRQMSEYADMPIERMNGSRTFTLRQNPQNYEHPEHWERARDPNIYRRLNAVGPATN